MPRKTNDNYDGFKLMLKDISRYTEQYRSFTTGRTYTDLLGETATGLLKDVAAKTEELSEQDIKRHKYSLEVFAAFCIYFCITKITSSFREDKVELDLAKDTENDVYERVLNRIKLDLEEKGECRYVRNLIKCSAKNAMLDQIRKENRFVGLDDGSSDDMDEDLKNVSKAVRVVLVDGTMDAIEKEEKRRALTLALAQTGEKGILSKKELYAICHFYGIGHGFKKLPNHKIAEKLGCSDAQATKLRNGGIKKLFTYIQNTPKLRQEFKC